MSDSGDRDAHGCAVADEETRGPAEPAVQRRGLRWFPAVTASVIVLLLLVVAVLSREGISRELSGRSSVWPFGSAHAHERKTGELPDGQDVTPFDTEYAAVERLDDDLAKALKDAAEDARADGIELLVNSGWRSKHYQQQLLDQRTSEYGSREEALKVVDTPQESAHVSGEAVDIGPTDAADWLVRNGADYGICQVFANERWHFELLTTPKGTCPPLREDANDDG